MTRAGTQSPRVRRRAGARGGQGALLLIVVVSAGILLLIGVRQLFTSSALSARAGRSAGATTASLLAESVVQEGLWQFQTKANDPAGPLFEALRQEVYAPKPGALGLGELLATPVSAGLFAQAAFKDFKMEGFEASVVYQRQFEDLPYERFGLVRLLARVRGPAAGSEKSVRELELARGFKVVLAGVPRPFDQAALFIGEGLAVTDLNAVNARRKRYIDRSVAIASAAERFATSAPASLTSRYEALRKSVPARQALEASAPELPANPGSLLFAVWRDGQQFPLENLDLDRRLQSDEARFQPDETRLTSAESALAAAPSDPAAHTGFLEAAEASLRGLSSLLGRIWAFHEGFRMIDSANAAHAELVSRQERLRLAHWRRVAFFRFDEGPGGRSCQQQLDELLKRLTPLNGVVILENTKEPIRLAGPIRGKLVLVTGSGGVSLDGVSAPDPAQDLLTVVSLGGPVSVAGEVHACVASVAPSAGGQVGPVQMQPGSTLRGGLILERIASGSQLAGRLVRASRYFSGTTGDDKLQRPRTGHYVVGISPVGTYDRVSRR